MMIESTAPCRVDLAGSTMDIWPLYLHHRQAVTVNFAVSLKTWCRLTPRAGKAITLRSLDQKVEESFDHLDTLLATEKYRHPLAAWAVRHFLPKEGFLLETNSEAPAGAGISGSSALLIATVSAFAKWNEFKWSLEKIREVAQNIEAQIIRVPTGCQDYYPALYGGVSAIELRVDGIHRFPINVDLKELNRRFVLAYTGKPRQSGINNWEVFKRHIDGDKTVRRNFDYISAIANNMRAALEKQDWAEAGRLLREEWNHRRKNAPGISTPLIDEMVKIARKAGAQAAKVCGAGGGGCVVFLCEPQEHGRVCDAVELAGGKLLDVTVAPKGLTTRVNS